MIRIPLFLAVTLAALPALAEDPKSKEALEFERTWLREHSERQCKRVNGILLTSTARREGDDLRIDWALNYDGPRPPLIVLKPMYPGNNCGATNIRIIVPDPKQVPSVILNQFGEFRWPNKADQRPGRDAYITVAKGETQTGTIIVSLRTVREKLVAEKVLTDPDRLPLELYVGLAHQPILRGAEFGFDAWTVGLDGPLFSVPQRIVIKKW